MGDPKCAPNRKQAETPAAAGDAATFYVRAMRLLEEHDVPFLVGGAFALLAYTGIWRDTKDVDIFLRPRHCATALQVFAEAGYQTELTDPVWLAKARVGDLVIDFIFNGANSLSEVTDAWFQNARRGEVLGVSVKLVPVEELILSKGFIMERNRFDGNDVAHFLYVCAAQLDWRRLLDLYRDHWRVLLSHLVMFGYIYPAERAKIPEWVMRTLSERLLAEAHEGAPQRICRGTLVSREQYVVDVTRWGLHDARVQMVGNSLVDPGPEP
jgi:hypothetical protein